MKYQFTRKAKPEPATTPTAIEPKTKTKLASPRPRSTTVVVKRRNCCRGNDVAAIGGNSGGGGSRGGNSGGGTSRGGNSRGGNSRGSNSESGNPGGKNSRAVNSRGGRGGGSTGGNRSKESSCQFVPVRRKPLGDYMVLEEEPLTSSLPTTSSSFLSDNPTPMSYAAAVESHPVSRLKVKVVLSPRLKRAGNQLLVKRQSPKNSPIAKVKVNPPSQSKPLNVQVNNSKRNMAQVAPQSRPAQGNNPKPSNSQTPSAGSSKSKSKRSKKAQQKQLAEVKSEVLLVEPQKPTSLQSSSPKFSEAFAYLDHHHEQMQRILAQQTAGQGPYPNRGHVKSCKHTAQLPTHRSLFDFDERLFKRGDLEAAALLAQNKVMLRKWLDPSMLIS